MPFRRTLEPAQLTGTARALNREYTFAKRQFGADWDNISMMRYLQGYGAGHLQLQGFREPQIHIQLLDGQMTLIGGTYLYG